MRGTYTNKWDDISIQKGIAMTIRRLRFPVKAFAAFLSIVCLLTFSLVAVSPVLAADPPAPAKGSSWDTWPKGAGSAGEAGGGATSAGINWGTWGWVLGGVAVVGVVALAAGGGGSSTSPPACPQ
jgi:hypothetical protein